MTSVRSPIKTGSNGRQYVDPADFLIPFRFSVDAFFRAHDHHEQFFNCANPALMWPDEETDSFHPTLLFTWACNSQYAHNMN